MRISNLIRLEIFHFFLFVWEKFQGAELIDHRRKKQQNYCRLHDREKIDEKFISMKWKCGKSIAIFSENEKFQKSLSAIIINRHAAAVRCVRVLNLNLLHLAIPRASVLHI